MEREVKNKSLPWVCSNNEASCMAFLHKFRLLRLDHKGFQFLGPQFLL